MSLSWFSAFVKVVLGSSTKAARRGLEWAVQRNIPEPLTLGQTPRVSTYKQDGGRSHSHGPSVESDYEQLSPLRIVQYRVGETLSLIHAGALYRIQTTDGSHDAKYGGIAVEVPEYDDGRLDM